MTRHTRVRVTGAAAAGLVLASAVGAMAADPSPLAPGPRFADPVAYQSGNHAHGIVAADLLGSPALDLAVANAYEGTVSVFIGRGDGTFAAEPDVVATAGTEPKSVAAADLDGDGALDLVTANQTSADVSVLMARDGGFVTAAYPACKGAHEAAVGDLDGDGDADIATACWGGNVVAILANDGTGVFAPVASPTVGWSGHSVTMVDVDGDGDRDLAVAGRSGDNVTIVRNDGAMTFVSLPMITVGSAPHSVRAADLDGDGDQDLVTANDSGNTVSVLLQGADGAFSRTDVATGREPKSVAIADLDADGIPDLITADVNGNYPKPVNPDGLELTILAGRGDGTFAQAVSLASPGTPFAVIAADLDGDGRLDLASANWHAGTASVLLQIP